MLTSRERARTCIYAHKSVIRVRTFLRNMHGNVSKHGTKRTAAQLAFHVPQSSHLCALQSFHLPYISLGILADVIELFIRSIGTRTTFTGQLVIAIYSAHIPRSQVLLATISV